jgi:hypothetical protein
MKKALIILMIVGLMAGALLGSAEAKKKKKPKPPAPTRVERTVDSVYQTPAIGTPESGGACPAATNSCANVPTGDGDNYVKVTVEDASGTPSAFRLGQDTDPATLGTEVTYGVFCGTTGDTPIALEAPGVELLTFVWAFGGATCPGAVATTGTVHVTFSNLP